MQKCKLIIPLLLFSLSTISSDTTDDLQFLMTYCPNIENQFIVKDPKSWCFILNSSIATSNYFTRNDIYFRKQALQKIQNIYDNKGVTLKCK